MNDNVDENFLRNLLQKCGPIEEQIIYRHPRTQRRLGIARIVFVDVKSARACIEKYNQQSVMGNVMNVFHDAFGEQCKLILIEASGEKKPQKSTIQPQPPINPPTVHVPPIPTFKPKDDMGAHLNDYQVDYNNPYTRSGHISGEHKQEESEWNDSRDKYDEYADDHRHYRYDKKDARRYDSKSSRYYKNEKDRDRRSDRRPDYRSHRDERDRDSSRRSRDYEYERKDREGRERRDRDHRSRDLKYREYKKSDRDYKTPLENQFSHSSSAYAPSSSHHHSGHHYSSFESTGSSTFHQYPPLP